MAAFGAKFGDEGRRARSRSVSAEDVAVETRRRRLRSRRDFRDGFPGRDRAIEVRFGANRIRKVCPIRTTFARGANCFIRLDPAKAFLFDRPGGGRIRTISLEPPGLGIE